MEEITQHLLQAYHQNIDNRLEGECLDKPLYIHYEVKANDCAWNISMKWRIKNCGLRIVHYEGPQSLMWLSWEKKKPLIVGKFNDIQPCPVHAVGCIYWKRIHFAGMSMGGALQLLLELQYISHGIPITKPQRDTMVEKTKAMLLAHITQLAKDSSSSRLQEFNVWCQRTGGTNASYRADVVSKLKSVEIAEATRFNLVSFKA